jgi:hypothetical protein
MAFFKPNPQLHEELSEALAELLLNKQANVGDVFLRAIEAPTGEIQVDYWLIRILVEDFGINPQAGLIHDENGEEIKPLHAACIIKNFGGLMALLDLRAYQGGLIDYDWDLAMRIVSKDAEAQSGYVILMIYALREGLIQESQLAESQRELFASVLQDLQNPA